MTTDRRNTPLAAALALVAALLAGGCDGGIFGTGDGSTPVGEPPLVQSPPASTGMDGGALRPDVAGPEGVDATDPADSADAAPTDSDADPASAPTSMPLVNAFPTDTVSERRVRLVNTSGVAAALVTDASGDGSAPPVDVVTPPVASGTASAYVGVPAGTSGLTIGFAPAPDGTVAEGSLRLAPLLLARSSATMLLVQDGLSSGAPEILALATLTATDDPAQAFVRVVMGTPAVDPDASSEPPAYTLVPDGDGADPGGAEVELPLVAAGAPENVSVPDYARVPVGDYRLVDSTGATLSALSLDGGDVRTLVTVRPDALLEIDDRAP